MRKYVGPNIRKDDSCDRPLAIPIADISIYLWGGKKEDFSPSQKTTVDCRV